jgi:hypothetical protein
MQGWELDWIKGLLRLGDCGGGINLLLRCARPGPSAGRCEVKAARAAGKEAGMRDKHEGPHSDHEEQDTEELKGTGKRDTILCALRNRTVVHYTPCPIVRPMNMICQSAHHRPIVMLQLH